MARTHDTPDPLQPRTVRDCVAAWVSSGRPEVDLGAPLEIGGVHVDGRLALAPMAGVSVQSFRRQGRAFGASLVCTEMVSSAGIHHDNERTKGYMRIAADEHPVVLQLFGSNPGYMAESARQVREAGADIIDINMGCPVRKVTKSLSGCALTTDPDLAVACATAVREASGLPVMVKLRRGMADGSRDFLALGQRLVTEAGVSSLTLHPRSADQMYTGHADHALTQELATAVDVPVFASGDIATRDEAMAVMWSTGCAGVMVGRAAQGNPWVLKEIMDGRDLDPGRIDRIVELARFTRAVRREMGDQRAAGFLRKFYGWYLKGNGFSKQLKNEIVQNAEPATLEEMLVRHFPEAGPLLADLPETWDTDPGEDTLLNLPVSIFAGG